MPEIHHHKPTFSPPLFRKENYMQKNIFLLAAASLLVSACTLEPGPFKGEDLLETAPAKKECIKKEQAKICQKENKKIAEIKTSPVKAETTVENKPVALTTPEPKSEKPPPAKTETKPGLKSEKKTFP
jgi:hypothetical protein